MIMRFIMLWFSCTLFKRHIFRLLILTCIRKFCKNHNLSSFQKELTCLHLQNKCKMFSTCSPQKVQRLESRILILCNIHIRIHICWYIGMQFCTVVVHILIKDISYDIRLNKSKISPFWGKIFKFRA